MKELLKISSFILAVSFSAWGIFGSGYSTDSVSKVEAIPYPVETIYDDTVREGVETIKQVGKDGEKEVVYEVTSRFGEEKSRRKTSEKVEKKPISEIIIIGTKKYYKCSNGIEYETIADKNECEKKIAWANERDRALAECRADNSKFNCWYDAYPGTTLHWNYYTYRSAPSSSGVRYGAICRDGTRSSATGRGACSHHGGVSVWLTR